MLSLPDFILYLLYLISPHPVSCGECLWRRVGNFLAIISCIFNAISDKLGAQGVRAQKMCCSSVKWGRRSNG